MPTLPLVFNGTTQAQYGSILRLKFDTGVTLMANGTEQRWKKRAPLFEFEFNYNSLGPTDRDSLKNFCASESGMDAINWSLGLKVGGSTVTYNNLTFDHDVFTLMERENLLYSCTLRMHQVQNKSYAIPSVSAVFPTLSVGAFTELPYAPSYRNLTSVNDSPTGQRYALRWWGGGFTGFPAAQLHRWNLSNPVLPDVDVATIQQYFTWAQGRLQTFSLTPEDHVAYTKCRFATDVLEMRFVGPQQTSISLPVVETN